MAAENVLIVCKRRNEGALRLGAALDDWLTARGFQSVITSADAIICGKGMLLAIVLGGDGTILGVARKLAGTGIPIVGINMGRVGFLTAIDESDWQEGVEKALNGLLPVRNCAALRWQIMRAGLSLENGLAVNDAVLSRGAMARVTTIAVRINNEHLGTLRSDGIIVSSPLGSTGYSVSAGGPILSGSLNAMSLTPICPFMANVPPMVFGIDDVFELTVSRDANECFLTVDGQEERPLQPGDIVKIAAEPEAVRLMGNGARFFARLHACGMWK